MHSAFELENFVFHAIKLFSIADQSSPISPHMYTLTAPPPFLARDFSQSRVISALDGSPFSQRNSAYRLSDQNPLYAATPMSTTFRAYQPIKPPSQEGGEFRLLTILPGERGSIVRCTLTTFEA